MFECFANDDVITIRGDGNQVRTYAPVSEAVSALLNAKPGELHILKGRDMTVKEVAALYPGKPVSYVPASPADILDGRQKAA